MQKLVNCRLVISSNINGKSDCTVIEGKGYYKVCEEEISVYFTSGEDKYIYVYIDNLLSVFCNESVYVFELNKENIGEIKSDNYTFAITTFATKIEVKDNLIVLNYKLIQNGSLIGTYDSDLSFD